MNCGIAVQPTSWAAFTRTPRVIDGTVCEKGAKSLSAHHRVAVAGIAQCAIHLKHKAATRLKFTQPSRAHAAAPTSPSRLQR